MPSYVDDPARWRERAEETRAIAEEMADTESYRIILGIAESYDRLAELAEQLIKRDQLLPITLTHQPRAALLRVQRCHYGVGGS